MTRDDQLKRELDSDAAAMAERLQRLQLESLTGDTELPRAQRFIARAFSSVDEILQAECSESTKGRGSHLKGWLRRVPPGVAAIIAMRECIRRCMFIPHKRPTMQELTSAIGRLYELEVKIAEAEAVNPVYMQRIHEQVRERNTTAQKHLRALYNTAYTRIMKGALDSHLSNAECMQLGRYGVQAVFDAGIIERDGPGVGVLVKFKVTDEVHAFLTGYDSSDVQGVFAGHTGPLGVPPDAWTSVNDGGYLSPRRKAANPLVKMYSIRRSARNEVRAAFTAENMPEVFEFANYLQSIAYELHEPTATAMRELWLAGGGVMGVPTREQPRKPEFPFGESWTKESAPVEEQNAFHEWKASMVDWYDSIRRWRGHTAELSTAVRTMREIQGPTWFSVYADTRGRWYYRGAMNPQGSDISKAILHFHEKKPLGVRGLFWLKVHIANSAGYDTTRMQDRADWTDRNWEAIARALDAPGDAPEVFGTDAPWMMFSAAWELREALRSGSPETYCTGIPIHKDATCSGLQHFSAMLRDPVGGQYVNLVDLGTAEKQDIYTRVASIAMDSVRRDLKSADPAVREMAEFWSEHNVPRSMAKKPVMTYVYGATLLNTAYYILFYALKDMRLKFPEGSQTFLFCMYLAKKLFHGIEGTVPASAAGMRWLKARASESPAGVRMQWKTPYGFLVQHDYQETIEKRINIRACGVQKIVCKEFTEGTVPSKMRNAISPNFVHALDGSHLVFTSKRMRQNGMSIVAIHDSYGTHPCDVDSMDKFIREEFVHLYEHDVLKSFVQDVQSTAELPLRGTLNLEDVLSSEFFFS